MKPASLPPPGKKMIDVFLFIPSQSKDKQKDILTIQDPDNTEYLLKLVFKVYSIPEETKIIRDANGRPYIDRENFHFSVSHSGQITAISVSGLENGCDIEKIRKLTDEDAIKNKILKNLPDEIAEMENGQLRALCASEAALKYYKTANLKDIATFKFVDFRKGTFPLWTIQWNKRTCSIFEKRIEDELLFIAYPVEANVNCTIHRNYFTISG